MFNYRGTINVSNSVLSGNYTHTTTDLNGESTGGGAVYTYGGTLIIADSTVSNNSAANGGGISALGTNVTISKSTLSENFADNLDNQGGGGVGIFVQGGTTIIVNSTLSANGALNPIMGSGGGIYVFAGTLNLTNSTVGEQLSVRRTDVRRRDLQPGFRRYRQH